MISPLPMPDLASEEYTIDEWYDLSGFSRFWWWVAQVFWYIFAWGIVLVAILFIMYIFRFSSHIDKMEKEFIDG